METPGSDTFYLYDAVAEDDQFSQVVSGFDSGVGTYVGLLVRVAGVGATFSGYWYYNDGGSTEQLLIYHGDGTSDVLWTGSHPSFVEGDTFRLTATGSDLLIEKNAVEVDTVVDTELTSGICGMTAIGAAGWKVLEWRGGSGLTASPGIIDADVTGVAIIDLGGAQSVDHLTANVTLISELSRPASPFDADRYLRVGWFAFGSELDEGDQDAAIYWTAPVWVDFLHTLWYPMDPSLTFTHFRYSFPDDAQVHLYLAVA